MTTNDLDESQPSTPPARSREPWTDSDYQTLLRLCREGLDLAALSQRLQRGANPVRERAKRLLPLDQRGVPGDRVLAQLRNNLVQDPDYDWAHHLAATPPPRPIVNHVLPAPNYAGVPGLADEELLTTAEALAQQGRPQAQGDHLAQALAREVCHRGLADELHVTAATRARQRIEDLLECARNPYGEPDWWEMADDEYPAWEDHEAS